MTDEDRERASVAADTLYDRKRGLVAIVVLVDLNTHQSDFQARGPSREIIEAIVLQLASQIVDASIPHITIEIDE